MHSRPIRDAGDLAWARDELAEARRKWAECPEFYERAAAGWERHIAYCIADLEQEDERTDEQS